MGRKTQGVPLKVRLGSRIACLVRIACSLALALVAAAAVARYAPPPASLVLSAALAQESSLLEGSVSQPQPSSQADSAETSSFTLDRGKAASEALSAKHDNASSERTDCVPAQDGGQENGPGNELAHRIDEKTASSSSNGAAVSNAPDETPTVIAGTRVQDADADVEKGTGSDSSASNDAEKKSLEEPSQPESQLADEPAEPEATVAPLEISRENGALAIRLNEMTGTVRLSITLSEGSRLPGGVYAHGDAIRSFAPSVDGTRLRLEIVLDAQGTAWIDLARWGSESGYDHAELYDEKGNELFHCVSDAQTLPSEFRASESVSLNPRFPSPDGSRTLSVTCEGYCSQAEQAPTDSIPRLKSADDGAVAYCNDQNLAIPAPDSNSEDETATYLFVPFSSDASQARLQGQNVLDFILFHGYPRDPTVNGTCSDPCAAQAATQWAIWSFTNPGSKPASATSQAWGDEFFRAYSWLVAQARSYDDLCIRQGAEQQPEYGTCLVFETDDNAMQHVLVANGAGCSSGEHDDASKDTNETDAAARVGQDEPGEDGIAEPGASESADDLQAAELMNSHRMMKSPAPTETLGSIEIFESPSDARINKQGLSFSIRSQATGQEIMTISTDSEGLASTGVVLPLGDYTIVATHAPDGYALAPSVAVHLSEEVFTARIKLDGPWNTLAKIRCVHWRHTSGIPGAHLQLLTSSGDVVDEWTSGENYHEIRNLAPGDYVIHEVSPPPDGYHSAGDMPIRVALTSSPQNFEFEYRFAEYPLSFTKVDADDGHAVQGAKFEIYACVNTKRLLGKYMNRVIERKDDLWKYAAEAASDATGVVDFGSLETGVYLLVETMAPEGYELPQDGWYVYIGKEISIVPTGDFLCPAPIVSDGAIKIPNTKRFELPAAGGKGPADFGSRLISAAVLIAAPSLYALSRRMGLRKNTQVC